MIVFNYDGLEDFLRALERRISNEVFAQYLDRPSPQVENDSTHTVILQYLGKLENSITVLHQCVLKLKKQEEKDQLIQTLQDAFEKAGGIQLIQGKIVELVLSLA
jgi:hypothetical protein